MSYIPDVKPGDWIRIGQKEAVVCTVYVEQTLGDIEVVYLDGNRAINEDVIWDDTHWSFRRPGPNGGYADGSPNLGQFVAVLRRGRF